jgi:hypothetical protein
MAGPLTVLSYLLKPFRNFVASCMAHPYPCVACHPHVEFRLADLPRALFKDTQ